MNKCPCDAGPDTSQVINESERLCIRCGKVYADPDAPKKKPAAALRDADGEKIFND